jgi:hypothetical protein
MEVHIITPSPAPKNDKLWGISYNFMPEEYIDYSLIFANSTKLHGLSLGFGMGQLSKLANVWTAEALFTTISKHVMGPTWPPIQWTVGTYHSPSKVVRL